MVNQSELAFRMLCRQHQTQLCYTPMLHARIFLESPKHRAKVWETCANDRPLIVQFCANDPTILLQAARLIEHECDGVDINLGCPQAIARRGRYGSFLLEETELVTEMVSTLHKHLRVPVTCKIRILPGEPERTIALARKLEAAGCSLLCVHGRTRDMIKERIGPNDFEIIRLIKEAVRIPVIANGGVGNLADVERALELTGADGVMSSEGILSDPRLFAGGSRSQMEVLQTVRDYNELVTQHPLQANAAKRPHMFKQLYQRLNKHTDLRDWLGKGNDFEIAQLVERIEAKEKGLSSEEVDHLYSGMPSWYNRRWTPSPAEQEAAQSSALADC